MSVLPLSEYEQLCKKADHLVDLICESDTLLEFFPCGGLSLSAFAAMVHAGFLMMSAYTEGNPSVVLLPKLHSERSVLQAEKMHGGRTVKRLCKRYTLKFDTALETILEACVDTHSDDWLTPVLREYLLALYAASFPSIQLRCFGVYRDGALKAGEFGIQVGNMYTSYSGFTREASAGTVQLYLSGLHLAEEGVSFWDLGMPMQYKTQLGASVLSRKDFVKVFRAARDVSACPDSVLCSAKY